MNWNQDYFTSVGEENVEAEVPEQILDMCVLLLLNILKAFDVFPHNLLLNKLEKLSYLFKET